MNRTLTKILTVVGLSTAIFLTGCGEQRIKPEDKKVQAMLEVNMPDFKHTNANVTAKIVDWMQHSADKGGDKVEFDSNGVNYDNGLGIVACKVRGEILNVKYKIRVDTLKPKLVKMTMTNFIDLPSDSDTSSDISYIFYNKVKDQTLDMADRLEDYLNKDTKKKGFFE